MLASFWEGLGSKFAERWAAWLAVVLCYWSGGFVAWMWHRGMTASWKDVEDWVRGRSAGQQVALVAAMVLALTISVLLLRRTTRLTTRMLEGYWPKALQPVWQHLVGRKSKRMRKAQERWQELIASGANGPSEILEYQRLDEWLRRMPPRPERRMPTRLGNIRRAAEEWPRDKYGLDPETCLPRLWLLLPDGARQELMRARTNLDVAAAVFLSGVLFVAWTFWAWWAAPLGLLAALSAYQMMPGAAVIYGDLVEAAFDIHRRSLYEALRWPLPKDPREERSTGMQVTQYLYRGSDAPRPRFTEQAPNK